MSPFVQKDSPEIEHEQCIFSSFINVPSARTYDDSSPLVRETDLQESWHHLQEHGVCGVVGLGGAGKTSLAVKLIRWKKTMFNYVLWISGGTADAFSESVSKIGDEINALRFCNPNGERQTRQFCDIHISEKVEAVKQWITNRSEDLEKLLIVIDDYIESACSKHVLKLLPRQLLEDKKIRFLVTSQCRDLESIMVYEKETVYLEHLPAEVAVNALKDTARKHVQSWTDSKEENDAASEIAELYGYLPLGVEHARAFIRTRRVALARYLSICKSSKQLPVEAPVYGDRNATMFNVYDRSCKEVFKDSSDAKEMMNIALSCAKCPIPLQLYSLGCRRLPKKNPLRKLAESAFKNRAVSPPEGARVRDGDLKEFYDIGYKLQKYHLVTIGQLDTFTVPQSIREALKRHQTETQRQNSFSCLSTLLTAVFEGSPTSCWRLYDRLFPHMMEWFRTMEQMSAKPNLRLLLYAGKRLSLSGYFTESCQLLNTCLTELKRNYKGQPSRREAEVLHSLGSAERRLGLLSEAVQHTMQALQVWQELPDSDLSRKGKARTKELYAEILLDLGNYENAEKLLEQTETVLVHQDAKSDEDLYEATACLVNLGSAYAGQRKHDKAMEKYEEAANRLANEDTFRYHLYRAQAQVVLAQKNLESSQLEDFEEDYKQCFQILAKISLHYNPKHRYYLWLCTEIAKLAVENVRKLPAESSKHTRRDRLLAALDMIKVSLEGHVEVCNSKHQKVAKSAEVAARVCLLYAENDRKKAAEFRDAAFKCLELAARIWKDTMKDLPRKICSAVTIRCQELQRLQKEAVANKRKALPHRRPLSTDRLAHQALRAVTNVAEDQRSNQTVVDGVSDSGMLRQRVWIMSLIALLGFALIVCSLFYNFTLVVG